LVRLILGYPEERAEVAMLKTHNIEPPEPVAVLSASEVQRVQSIARRVHAESEIHHYAVSLCRATRASGKVVLGASPRASLALLQAAKTCRLLPAQCSPTDSFSFQISKGTKKPGNRWSPTRSAAYPTAARPSRVLDESRALTKKRSLLRRSRAWETPAQR
jgi:hypothetical protein